MYMNHNGTTRVAVLTRLLKKRPGFSRKNVEIYQFLTKKIN